MKVNYRRVRGSTVDFVDANGETAFSLSTLFAVDAAGAYTEKLGYEIISADKNSAVIEIRLSTDYVNDPARVFPVLIDPSVIVKGASLTYDSFVSSSHPSTNYYMSTSLCTGKDSTFGVRRSYIKFDIPNAVTGKTVTLAYINIRRSSGSTPSVKAYSIGTGWTSSTITWYNKPEYNSSSGSETAKLVGDNWYRITVTDFAQQWCKSPTKNHGVVLRDTNESSTSKWTNFYSSDAAASNKPELVIFYNVSGSKTNHYANMYLGIEQNDTRITEVQANVENAFLKRGYGGKTYKYESKPKDNITKDILKAELQDKKIFSCITHGSPTCIRLPGDVLFTVADLNSINSNNMKQLQLVYLGACQTGAFLNTGRNFAQTMYDKGADVVVSFSVKISTGEADIWSENFMVSIANGNTVQTALTYADKQTADYYTRTNGDHPRTTTAEHRYVLGNVSIKPCP